MSDRVKAAIDQSDLSISKVGELSGIPRVTLDRRLRGVNPWTTDELAAIARTLDMEPEVLVGSRSWPEAS